MGNSMPQALIKAIEDNKFEEFKRLINRDNLNSKDNDASTPLHSICWFGRRDMYDYVMSTFGNNEIMLNERTKYWGTPLMWACNNGRIEIVQDLILRGADINMKDKRGKAAFDLLKTEEMKLMYTAAVETRRNQLSVVVDPSRAIYGISSNNESKIESKSEINEATKETFNPIAGVVPPATGPADDKGKHEHYTSCVVRGDGCMQSGQVEDAVIAYTSVINIHGENTLGNHEVYFKRCQAYLLLGSDDLALRDVCKCLQLNKVWLEAHVTKSKIHLKLGDVNECIAACNTGLASYALNQDLQDTLAEALCIVASGLGLTLSLYIKYCQAHIWKLEQNLEIMTKLNDIETLGKQIAEIKDKVQHSLSWKELRSQAEYESVVNMLLAELKQLLPAHLVEYRALAKQKHKTSRYEEVKYLLSQLEVRVKEIEALVSKMIDPKPPVDDSSPTSTLLDGPASIVSPPASRPLSEMVTALRVNMGLSDDLKMMEVLKHAMQELDLEEECSKRNSVAEKANFLVTFLGV